MRYFKDCRAALVLLGGSLLLAGCGGQTSTTPAAPQAGAKSTPASSAVGEGSGVVQNVRQAVKRVADMGDLKNLALAYNQHVALNDRGPSGIEEIKDSLSPKMIESLKDNSLYTVIWKIRSLSGHTIIAYVTEPDSQGTRLVATGDGSVTRMNEVEFTTAKAASAK